MDSHSKLHLILAEGESLKVEFKEQLAHLDREIVAFANTSGGSVYLGVDDDGKIVGIDDSNRLRSQIQDIAHNCDPSITLELLNHQAERVIEVKVPSGNDRPYRCKEGFYVREGPSTLKLKRDEIVQFINKSGKIRYDEAINDKFKFPEDFSQTTFKDYLRICGIPDSMPLADLLTSLSLAEEQDDDLVFTNAGVLFFAKGPKKFFPESQITCVRYQSNDRISIIDKKEYTNGLIDQIDEAASFVKRHTSVEARIGDPSNERIAARQDIYDYPMVAIREAIVNAVTHRDYFYDSSHIYVHVFQDHIDIENPGGLFHGLSIESLGTKSVRRNRLIADLLQRAGYIEKVGTGFIRMADALGKNNNPPYEITATNFFNIRFYKRIAQKEDMQLSIRQAKIYSVLSTRDSLTTREVANALNFSEDTALRELRELMSLSLVEKHGVGRNTHYALSVPNR